MKKETSLNLSKAKVLLMAGPVYLPLCVGKQTMEMLLFHVV